MSYNGAAELSHFWFIVECRWRAAKINFILKFHLHFKREKQERKVCEGARQTFVSLLSTCLLVRKFRFDLMLCFHLGNEYSDAAILIVHAGRMFPASSISPRTSLKLCVKSNTFVTVCRDGVRHFHFGGATGGASFATRGAVNGLCRTFRKRPTPVAWCHAENFGGATGGASFATRGAVNGLCRTFRKRPTERDLILGDHWGARQNFGGGSGLPWHSPSSAPDGVLQKILKQTFSTQ